MNPLYIFAAESADASPLAALGIDFKSFLFQLATFALVFLVLKQFAFKPIGKMLARRREVIDAGVRAGLEMEKLKAKLDKDIANEVSAARAEGDKIVASAHKEAREIIREAEKTAQRKADHMLADAEAKLDEESKRVKRKLEKDIVSLVSDATETIVEEKVDAIKDASLIDKALRGKK